jgi:hypothetical protein
MVKASPWLGVPSYQLQSDKIASLNRNYPLLKRSVL